MTEQLDAVVIGGGFYGCAIALDLARKLSRIVVLERERELLMRASYVNQARVHTGYHYPRSLQTAASSAKNLRQFEQLYPECIDASFTALYAVARTGSKVNRGYFQRFCARLGLPLKPAPKALARLFSPGLIDGVFECQEYAFDAALLRSAMKARLARAGLEARTGATVLSAEPEPGGGCTVVYVEGGQEKRVSARWVFNTTYANLNRLAGLEASHRIGLRHQVTEVCLVEPPEPLRHVGVTVMDGAYFSTMPFPARKLHSLTHVRYTPHFTWDESSAPELVPDEVLARHAKETRFEWMRRDASRYLPILAQCEYRAHLFEIKTTLTNTTVDDARPIAFHREPSNPQLVSVLGGKIDNIFDVLKVLDTLL
jgi:glycine/D-amino acid oxidase-like deaminating enzyme